jgi:hypothetical protein
VEWVHHQLSRTRTGRTASIKHDLRDPGLGDRARGVGTAAAAPSRTAASRWWRHDSSTRRRVAAAAPPPPRHARDTRRCATRDRGRSQREIEVANGTLVVMIMIGRANDDDDDRDDDSDGCDSVDGAACSAFAGRVLLGQTARRPSLRCSGSSASASATA